MPGGHSAMGVESFFFITPASNERRCIGGNKKSLGASNKVCKRSFLGSQGVGGGGVNFGSRFNSREMSATLVKYFQLKKKCQIVLQMVSMCRSRANHDYIIIMTKRKKRNMFTSAVYNDMHACSF